MLGAIIESSSGDASGVGVHVGVCVGLDVGLAVRVGVGLPLVMVASAAPIAGMAAHVVCGEPSGGGMAAVLASKRLKRALCTATGKRRKTGGDTKEGAGA